MAIAAFLLLCGQAAAAQTEEPLTLPKAVDLALKQNPALEASEDQARASRARVGEARAAWFPRVDVSQGFTRGNNPVYVFGTLLTQRQFNAADFNLSRLNAPTPLDNFQSQIAGQMSLFDSGRTHLREAGARKMATAADYSTEQDRQDLILRVVRAYYGAITAREELEAADKALASAQSNETRVGTMEKAGLVVSSDLLSAQVFRAQMEDREIRARNGWEVARLNLGRELGLAAGAMPQLGGQLEQPRPLEGGIDEWDKTALAERPALRAAELQRQAATANRQLARADFGPQIAVFANVERDARTLAGPSGTNWTAGAKLDLNLFAGGANRARLAEAVAEKQQAEHQLEWLRSGIELEVRQAYLDAQAAAQRAAASRDAASQAEESLRIIQNRYQAGLVTITELLRAQSAQLDARTGYLAALYDWRVARAQLERAAGRLTVQSSLLSEGGRP
ncbi:MAG TPA: TolC family protein [Candidatus Acidoferrales bacterium]|nr:TolC family protein [Candidatus Acidoferrales bacterium]